MLAATFYFVIAECDPSTLSLRDVPHASDIIDKLQQIIIQISAGNTNIQITIPQYYTIIQIIVPATEANSNKRRSKFRDSSPLLRPFILGRFSDCIIELEGQYSNRA